MRKTTPVSYTTKNRILKVCLFIAGLFLYNGNVKAQLFYTETFDGTACAATSGCDPSLVSWTTTNTGANGGAANKFYVSCQENGNAAGVCGSGCGTDQSLHVGNVSTSSAAFIFCPTGDCGAAYDDSGPGEITNKRCESPTISCVGQSNITIAFNYIETGENADDDASLEYFDGATWTTINAIAKSNNAGCAGQGRWTAFSATLPASADGNPSVRIGFLWKNDGDGVAADPSFAVDDITLTSAASANTITTGVVVGSPFCACTTLNVPFTSTGTFTAGNIYTAQLSNAAGSFAAPVAIGTLVSTANVGVIACTIPCGTPTGAGYRIRVVSSAPAVTGSDNGVNLTINAVVVPSVTIVAAPPGPICAGTSVTFTATPTNGGAGPTYQWQLNGSNIGGATSSTYTTSTLANGDVITVVMTSNAACASPTTATSTGITMTVNPAVVPSVTIVATNDTICAGDPVTFTATPTNGGTTPTYQWQLNGTNIGGATSSIYNTSTLVNGDVITVIMTSNAACASPLTATSNAITISVQSSLVASVSIISTPDPAVICAGDLVTFASTPTNGGSTPGYQWQLNGTNIGGATATTYNSSTLVNGDVITVIMTSSSTCATGSPATSNSITITVTAAVAASVSISAAPSTTICSGDAVTFTATPTGGGSSPTYQWQLNGTNIGGATSSTYTTSTLANGDQITVIMTSSSSCATGSPATSSAITMTVNPSVTPSVSIAGGPTTICVGDPAIFTATPTNGGTSPSYQWQVNGTNVGTNSPTYTSTTLANGDVITVIMTSNALCASPASVTSNSLTMVVNNCNPPVANFTADNTVFCTSGCVNFTDLSTNSPTSWLWAFPGSSTPSSILQNPTGICYSSNGSYTVILIVSNASGSDTLTQVNYITVGVPTQVTISGNTVINACESTVLTADPGDGIDYSWGPNINILCEDCVSATVSPTTTQDYYVTYTSPDGCVDSDTITVVVTNLYSYFMPTGFSPNGDGMNDVIRVQGRGIDFITLKIYDRIGEKVFETSNIDDFWDGRLHGMAMNSNVFVYMLEVTFCNGEVQKEQGNITLVK